MEDLLIRYLAEGKTQAEIAILFKENGVKPNCLSSVEKELKKIRKRHKASTMFHLGVILAKKGLAGKSR